MSKSTEKQLLVDKIVEAIQDTKGEDIQIFDLSGIENSVADTFVICSGNSNTQVSAIAGNIEKKVRNDIRERPWHVEGTGKCNVGFGRLRFRCSTRVPKTDT